MPCGFSRKKSKLKQKSKTWKSCLSSSGPNSSGQSRVPRPIICQNLMLRVDRLEEDQVRHLGHVDAGVEHVYRDRDVRRLSFCEKSSSRLCGYFSVVVDDPREVPRVAAGSGG